VKDGKVAFTVRPMKEMTKEMKEAKE